MFKLGEELTESNYEAAANWCTAGNEYTIEDNRIVRIPALTAKQKAEYVRMQRDILLSASDKYMMSDYPIEDDEREIWRRYRQYLRDVPAAEEFPDLEVKTFEQWKGA